LKKERKEEDKVVMLKEKDVANYLVREREMIQIMKWLNPRVVMMTKRLTLMLEDLKERVLER